MLCSIADKYFGTLSPLAERIAGDINNIKGAYENLWNELSVVEQEQIINETVINPQVLLKYSLNIQDLYGRSGCLFDSGAKIVVDEPSGISWRDEHSAPFSWKSRSLLELCSSNKCVPALPPNDSRIVQSTQQDTPVGSDIPKESEEQDSETNAGGAFSNFCAKLKLLPGKSYGYQVNQNIDEKGFLCKIKNNAVCKLQNTFKSMGGKVSGPFNNERDVLVVGGGAVIVPRVEKVTISCPSKPKSPPPPPPPRVQLKKDHAEVPLLEPSLPVLTDTSFNHCSSEENISVKDEEQLVMTEDITLVPKSGFDFLDDW